MLEKVEDEIRALAVQLQEILEKNLLKDPKIAHDKMIEARNIRSKITQYGYLVDWKANLNSETFELEVTVDIFKPKENMAPEEQEIYDRWFLSVNGYPKNT